jgi:hypothetical protein
LVSVGWHAIIIALLQSALLQHGWLVEHFCPYCEHVGGGAPDGFGFVQLPLTDPGGTRHVRPVQQSPLVEHEAACTPQPPAQCSAPVTSATQESPVQQSPAYAQVPPSDTHVAATEQRGTPSESGWQQLAVVHPQQSLAKTSVWLHPPREMGWQTSPAGTHVFLHVVAPIGQLLKLGAPHVPIPVGFIGSGTHTTNPAPGNPLSTSPPQQSLFTRHASPNEWQPDPGRQTLVALLPYGPHTLLQQVPQPLHNSPSMVHAGFVMLAQTPTPASATRLQAPVQQSPSRAQRSPLCTQYETCDGAAHRPGVPPSFATPRHVPLQQSPLLVHELPAILQPQVGHSAVHVPPAPQIVLQQSPFEEHG